MASKWFYAKGNREPKSEIPIIELNSKSFNPALTHGVRVTWFGHSTTLVEIDGHRILTDPVWSKRCSPSSIMGPARFHPVPIAIEELPNLDVVLISHDHYDHLDKDAVCKLAETGVRFYIPLGVGAHLEKWGIDNTQFTEFDWWDSLSIKNNHLQLIATPAIHFSGRGLLSSINSTLWVSWVIISSNHRVFFSGDTGNFPGISEIGEKYGPFDLTMIKIGAFDNMWPDIHLTPEQASEVHIVLKGDILMPIHWGTYNLAFHDWFEPPNRLMAAIKEKDIKCIIPRPGQKVFLSALPQIDHWWDKVE